MTYANKPSNIKIIEVGMRDGLQNEHMIIDTNKKLLLIDKLSQTGLKYIEITAFVNPKWIPSLYDHEKILALYKKKKNVNYQILVPNIEGYEKLKNFNFDEFSIVISASNTHNQRNINRNIKESIAYYHELANFAKSDRKPFRAYISCSFGCPYEGKIAVSSVVELSRRIMDMGAYELSISDTIGVANPTSIEMLLEELFKYIPPDKIALHLHNTRNLALTNIYTAIKLGITSFDASFGGLGGCPYAHGASGNIATEDLVAMLYALGIKTSINLDKLCEVSRCVKEILKKQLSSKIFSIYQK